MARSISRSDGFWFRARSATADMICPDWQYPHCGTSSAIHAACTASAALPERPSMVTISLPLTEEMGVTQERRGTPSTYTVQLPHSAMPQPTLVPVNPSSSRMTQSSGVSPSAVTTCFLPFTVTVTVAGIAALSKTAADEAIVNATRKQASHEPPEVQASWPMLTERRRGPYI